MLPALIVGTWVCLFVIAVLTGNILLAIVPALVGAFALWFNKEKKS